MALTKEELIGSLQNEVRILQHLCTKIEPTMVDYRPTPKQRSTIELLRYLTNMGRSSSRRKDRHVRRGVLDQGDSRRPRRATSIRP